MNHSRSDRPRSRHHGWALVVLLAALAGLAAACGGGSPKTASASTTTSTTTGSRSGAGNANFAAARAKFTSCLEAHGVPASQATQRFGGRGGFGRGATGSATPPSSITPPTTTAAYGAAFAACRSDLPARGPGGFANLQNSATGRAYLQCLQLHGVTIPSTPPTTKAGAPGAAAGGANRSFASNPNFAAARQACSALAPSRSAAGSTTPAG